MGDVFFGDNVKIYIDKDNATASSFSASQAVETSIFSFKVSGGEQETETKPLLGNANIVIEKPTSEVEISMDVAIKVSAPTFWDELLYGSGLTSATRASPCSVGFEVSDDTTTYQILFNNVRSVSFEKTLEAGEFLQGTITFKLAPTDDSGNANIKVGDDSNPVFTVS